LKEQFEDTKEVTRIRKS